MWCSNWKMRIRFIQDEFYWTNDLVAKCSALETNKPNRKCWDYLIRCSKYLQSLLKVNNLWDHIRKLATLRLTSHLTIQLINQGIQPIFNWLQCTLTSCTAGSLKLIFSSIMLRSPSEVAPRWYIRLAIRRSRVQYPVLTNYVFYGFPIITKANVGLELHFHLPRVVLSVVVCLCCLNEAACALSWRLSTGIPPLSLSKCMRSRVFPPPTGHIGSHERGS